MDSKELAIACMKAADDRKAEDIIALDVTELTSVADYFVICTGTSAPHLRAILNEIEVQLKEQDIRPISEDGIAGTNWVALDYNTVIVHVMQPEARKKYELEHYWGDAPRLLLQA